MVDRFLKKKARKRKKKKKNVERNEEKRLDIEKHLKSLKLRFTIVTDRLLKKNRLNAHHLSKQEAFVA